MNLKVSSRVNIIQDHSFFFQRVSSPGPSMGPLMAHGSPATSLDMDKDVGAAKVDEAPAFGTSTEEIPGDDQVGLGRLGDLAQISWGYHGNWDIIRIASWGLGHLSWGWMIFHGNNGGYNHHFNGIWWDTINNIHGKYHGDIGWKIHQFIRWFSQLEISIYRHGFSIPMFFNTGGYIYSYGMGLLYLNQVMYIVLSLFIKGGDVSFFFDRE